MRALTVQQPWAWAIVHGGKDVENRTRNLAGSYRGPVAIHAGLTVSEQGMRDDQVRHAWAEHGEGDPLEALVVGAFVGVADLVSVHHDSDHGRGCPCSPWADRDVWHLTLAGPRPLPVPIPCKGQLGLWTPLADVLEQLQAVAR